MRAALARPESARLAELEQIVRSGIETFHAVGRALAEIRDRRLYRQTHHTFEDYCRERWGFSRQHGLRLIDAAGVVEDVTPTGVTPESERQARELVPLPPEQRRLVWEAATAEGQPPPTAARLKELTAKALASLSPDEQREVVEAAERKVMTEARQVGGEDTAARKGQIGRLCRRLSKLHAGLCDVADEADAALAAYLGVIGRAT